MPRPSRPCTCHVGANGWGAITPSPPCPVHQPDIGAIIREALERHLASRRADPAFIGRLRDRVHADRQILQRLD